jgi:hypothetical protein
MLKRYSIKIDKIKSTIRAIKKRGVNKVLKLAAREHDKIFIERKNINEMKNKQKSLIKNNSKKIRCKIF